MSIKRSRQGIVLIFDIVIITVSFLFAMLLRYKIFATEYEGVLPKKLFFIFLFMALCIYSGYFSYRKFDRLEQQSRKEIFITVLELQTVFAAVYVMFFFVSHVMFYVSRIFVGTFVLTNLILCTLFRLAYRKRCLDHLREYEKAIDEYKNNILDEAEKAMFEEDEPQHVYLIGSKSIGMYGGYESFIMNLLQEHKKHPRIKYHVACKANGSGYMEVKKLPGAKLINDDEFTYCNAHCFMIRIPDRIGPAQAIYYDLNALSYACDHIESNHIPHPIVYILASRIGPFEKKYVNRIHAAGGKVYHNPDGREDKRGKWNGLIRKYWKFSERYAVKNADLVVCDSKCIEEYIKEEYAEYNPKTTFIAYGSHIVDSGDMCDRSIYNNWLKDHNLKDGKFFLSVGRFVPENNFETMICEYMKSNTKCDFAIITTHNDKFASELEQKVHFKRDKRIKFVGTVYDPGLLNMIRVNAKGYLHGHEVGGTNPSLLEALGATNVNLLYDVGFNREVGESAALYWTKDSGNLASLIDKVDSMSEEDRLSYGENAKKRISDDYTWKAICKKYENAFLK